MNYYICTLKASYNVFKTNQKIEDSSFIPLSDYISGRQDLVANPEPLCDSLQEEINIWIKLVTRDLKKIFSEAGLRCEGEIKVLVIPKVLLNDSSGSNAPFFMIGSAEDTYRYITFPEHVEFKRAINNDDAETCTTSDGDLKQESVYSMQNRFFESLKKPGNMKKVRVQTV